MIATLYGMVAEKLGEVVVIDINGLGYGVLVPAEDYGKLSVGESAKVFVYEHIRENSHDLYGFTELGTKRLFQQLLDVNGVGPKMALNILGTGSAENVRRAIAEGDVKYLQAAVGVGKRVAERIVIDLKDKVGLSASVDVEAMLEGNLPELEEAVQGLMSLGYTQADAQKALIGVSKDLPSEERIRRALMGTAK